MTQKLEQNIAAFPNSPGVYLMQDAGGKVIYVGKAIDLRKRVSSYFRDQDDRYQVKFLMHRVAAVDYVVTDNEKEALLLENTLIKKHKPRYNLQLRDDKSYISIKLTLKDSFPRVYTTRQVRKDGSIYFGPYTSARAAHETTEFIQKFFRLRTCNDHEFANRSRPCLQYQIHRCDAPCVGYISQEEYRGLVQQVKLFLQGKKQDLIKILEKEMQRQSEAEEFEKAAQTRNLIASIYETLEKQKMNRHHWLDQDVIGIYREGEMVTFCILVIRQGKVWESRLYHLKSREDHDQVLETFLGQYYNIVSSFEEVKGDENVPLIPDEILVPYPFASEEILSQILAEKRGKKVEIFMPQRGDKSDLLELALRNAYEGFKHRSKKTEEIKEILIKLQEALGLQNFPQRIECFDISNISGREAVGSLVSFVDGLPDKKGYRRFKIKTVEGPNDFAMMREVLHRRLVRTLANPSEKWAKPDLMVIDGGKGQLSTVVAVMDELNITGVDLIALAKEKEGETQDKIFLPGRKNPVLLGHYSNVLHLLMRVRDEAHRFAITYHRKLRHKTFLPSSSR